MRHRRYISCPRKIRIHFKKKEIKASQRNNPKVQKTRSEWFEWIKDVDPAKLIFLDETGIKTNCTPRYGWSERGKPCIGTAPASWKSYSAIAAISSKEVIAAATLEGAFNKNSFRIYMEEMLYPSLKRGDIVVMDNLSVHKDSFDKKKFKRKGIIIKYLPPYSPDFNPIESMWGKMKSIIRKLEPRDGDQIWDAVNEALWDITEENLCGWYHGCGYFH